MGIYILNVCYFRYYTRYNKFRNHFFFYFCLLETRYHVNYIRSVNVVIAMILLLTLYFSSYCLLLKVVQQGFVNCLVGYIEITHHANQKKHIIGSLRVQIYLTSYSERPSIFKNIPLKMNLNILGGDSDLSSVTIRMQMV